MRAGKSVEQAERERFIAQYEAGYDEVMRAIEGITPVELDTPETPGEWSPRQAIHHLADSEMTAGIRMRRMIAEDNPVLVGYDQDEFARRLYYDRPLEPSLLAFRAARESSAAILHRLTDDQWQRIGTHSEYGPLTVDDWLISYAAHAHDHADQIRRARAAAGVLS
jgi:hypothetical protein